MKTINVHFTSSKKFMPIGCWVIKWYMGTSYSHVAFEFSTSRNKSLIYEAVGLGVRFINKTLWLDGAEIKKSYELSMTDDQYNALMDYCIDNAGVKYGYWQNVGIFVAQTFKMKKNPFAQKQEICSQLLGEVLVQLGYVFEKNLELITPRDIEDELIKPR